jgi:hypothetical protein
MVSPDIVLNKFTGDEKQILRKVIIHEFLKPIQGGIPNIIGIIGKSGFGKSLFALYCQQIIYEEMGLDFLNYVESTTLIKPNDYAPKVREILYNPKLKKIITVQMDEAKFLLNAHKWQSFKNQSTQTITAICRTKKPMIFFILAQKRKDIDPKVRDTLDYYVKIDRDPFEKPKVQIYELYETDDDYENPVIKKKPIYVTIRPTHGKTQTVVPVFRPMLPRQDIIDKYNAIAEPAKDEQLLSILDKMEEEAKKLGEQTDERIEEYVDYLKDNPGELDKIWSYNPKTKKGKIDRKLAAKKTGYTSHQLDKIEEKLMQSLNSFEGKPGDDLDAVLQSTD